MNIYHAWCDLKVGVSDIAFREGVAKYLDHLRAQELIESFGGSPTAANSAYVAGTDRSQRTSG